MTEKRPIDFETLCENCHYHESWTEGNRYAHRCIYHGGIPRIEHCFIWASLKAERPSNLTIDEIESILRNSIKTMDELRPILRRVFSASPKNIKLDNDSK